MYRNTALSARSFGAYACTWIVALLLVWTPARAGPGHHAVATAHPLATDAAEAVLAAGGNAFDAAIAVTAALGVAQPQGSGLGGGGFFLLYHAESEHSVMLDARETAPEAAHRDLFLDDAGEPVPGLSLDGALAAAIPGTPAALVHLAEHYGRLSLGTSLAPAIELAEEGVPADLTYLQMAEFRKRALRAGADAAGIFLDDGELPAERARILQPDLARTLRRLAEHGHSGFYEGEIAQRLVEGVRAEGGIWSLDDLARYRVVERRPVVLEYQDARIVTAAPPSSGGIVIGQILNILAAAGAVDDSGLRTHLLVEAMRRAYRDRALYLGDPDHVPIPVTRLLSADYAADWYASIDPDRATPSASLPLFGEAEHAATTRTARESRQTSHFSVMDADGNRVSGTITLNYPFGSGLVPPDTGVLLNNEMDDFATHQGSPNVYGLIGFDANAVGPHRRPLSSMSPTFVETPDRIAVLGSPGGSRIITIVLQGILATLEGADAEALAARPRFHHQYLPDRVEFETGAFTSSVRASLVRRGHRLAPQLRPFGDLQVVVWDRSEDRLEAASDPRGDGTASVFVQR
ncbi:gamma-glutamyltransferase [Thioalkalivibrio paradoxus]|uniref:Glutathione hydrolase proenzyme n=1 Tax=Thioalkalivibrio paradoxus ARh 1 TaxID=713585 RepID=W0DS20_9GAMM|nr:gamma-glutamyltransferase [Thioalkalivibrio paradoxus]AHE99768.1 gamma-glutamyltransferase [Thioalkalivibrio paradoxus ARh 1]